MTRTNLRLLTILFLMCMIICGFLLYWQVQKQQVRVQELESSRAARQLEFDNLRFLVISQDKLDSLTMDERLSTQLDVLKYLGLEKIKLDFRIDGRDSRSAGDTTLIARNVTVQARKSYQEINALVDQLFNSGKFNIVNLTLTKGDDSLPESTALMLQGRLFSLQKQGEIDAAPDAAETVQP